ncbi:MAG: inositol monophosphatase family protein [Alphaproteobacteria bacterium]
MAAARLAEIAAFAETLADAAGEVVRRYFRRPLAIAYKEGMSPVTEADRAVEARLRELIAARYPRHGVVGEELADERADADEVWVIDPIDGTRLFINGIPMFGTLIAFVRAGAPLLGVIDQPITGERWIGGDGVPTTLNRAPVRCRACESLCDAVLITSSPHYYDGENLAALDRLRDVVNWTHYGTDCYGFGLIAGGFADLGIENGVAPHDFCALAPVIENAGGVMTDWEGAPLRLDSGPRVLAAGDRRAHALALERIAG